MDNQSLLKNSFKQAIRELEREDDEEEKEKSEIAWKIRERKIKNTLYFLCGMTAMLFLVALFS